MGLKSIIKGIVVGLVIVVFSLGMMTSANAFKAQDEAKVISSNPENIYTVYIGMPRADVEANFGAVKGWKMKTNKYVCIISRNYSKWASVKAGASLKQEVIVDFLNTNHVNSVSSRFDTDSMRLAKDIYNVMSNSLVSNYGSPYKGNENPYLLDSAKWLANGHVYFLHMEHVENNVRVTLLVRPIHDFDYR